MRQQIQQFGRTLSGMVMPNIGAFIAWGFITALFIPEGWWPNGQLAQLVGPMLTYLLPLLIAYTAGRNVAGERGGVIGAIAAVGVIVGSGIGGFNTINTEHTKYIEKGPSRVSVFFIPMMISNMAKMI